MADRALPLEIAEKNEWIVKLCLGQSARPLSSPLRGVRFHNENEHLCLELARLVGCQAAVSTLIHAEEQTAIAVERYDRRRRGDVIVRLHQEDLSQALGANPRLKSVYEGGPGFADVVGLLRDQSSHGIDDGYRFVRALAFNCVVAGTAAHPRNYSLLIAPLGHVTLAPLYDLASALLLRARISVADLPFAMGVAGRRNLGNITRDVWLEQAKEIRLDAGRFIAEIDDLVNQVADVVASVAEDAAASGLDKVFAARFASRIGCRARALK